MSFCKIFRLKRFSGIYFEQGRSRSQPFLSLMLFTKCLAVHGFACSRKWLWRISHFVAYLWKNGSNFNDRISIYQPILVQSMILMYWCFYIALLDVLKFFLDLVFWGSALQHFRKIQPWAWIAYPLNDCIK